ncbi:polysaccharide deacetylase family protein [Azospirillum sp. TSO35-2]|uniref:polysaccharide deacetylase family protein n=1 Tax=Azospirillum sp. TSO35-2 TaxID=716796 RepID=UPI000D612226|nr:polysaccharide deacetylase family protein [Azospirillum sp. TSO35-2]PWC33058.1 polysaccharide deacetylase [Azospirillum sp. TSO35-2]
MIDVVRRAVLPVVRSAVAAALILSPLAAAAQPRSYAATHGAAPFVTEHLLPGSPLNLGQVDRKAPAAQVVALTIDDGPDANDRRILDVLREHGAKATFFFIGSKVEEHKDIAALVAASGNEVGSHTQTHPMMTDLSLPQQEWNLAKADVALAAAGVHPAWFRPPYGDVNDGLAALARVHGMQTVLWTIDTQDWKDIDDKAIFGRVAPRLAPGAVILMHSTKAASLKALPALLDEGRRRGYRFVTMTEWEAAMRQAEAPPPVALLHPAPRK